MKLIDFLVQELPKCGGWPEGAVECCWFRDEKDLDFFDINGNWDRQPINPFDLSGVVFEPNQGNMQQIKKHEYEAALAASQHPVWNGEGLPPVGIECLVIPNDNLWGFTLCGNYRGKVIAYKGERFWFEVDFGEDIISRTDKVDFKPIQTEAERKRKETAQDMSNLFGNGIKIDEKQGFGKTWFELYDAIAAGKIAGVKLAD